MKINSFKEIGWTDPFPSNDLPEINEIYKLKYKQMKNNKEQDQDEN